MRSMLRIFTCLALAAACDDVPPPVFDIAIVGADGGDPTRDTDVDQVTVRMRQGDGEVTTRSAPPDALDLSVHLTDWSNPVALTVELTGPTTHLVGAPPPFLPLETGGLLVVPVGPSGECMALEGSWAELAHARAASGVARSGTYAILAGGVDGSGRSAEVEAFDLLRMAPSEAMAPLEERAGPTMAATLGNGDMVLVVPEEGAPVRYNLANPTQRLASISLHAGAGAASAVVGLADGGAVVVGGATASGPVTGVTWAEADGTTRAVNLAVPRAFPAVAVVGGSLLVVGGMDAGEPLAEVLGPADDVGLVVEEAPEHGVRDGAVLAVRGSRTWLLGGVDEAQIPRTDTLLISGCPDACAAEEGPEWPEARMGVALAATDEGVHLMGGVPPTDRVDRVRLDTNPPRLEDGWPLAVPRADAGAVALDTGIVAVLAGRGPEGFLRSVELCFPAALPEP
jgi:hypothetical protein